MSLLLEVLGRGLLAELGSAFPEVLFDDGKIATRELEHAVLVEPYNVDHQQRLGVRALKDRRHGQARAAFEEVLKLKGSERAARVGLACTLDEMGTTRKALEQLEIAHAHDCDDAPTSFAIGFLQEKLGETERAITAYEAALNASSTLRNAHERLAAIYLKKNDLASAITHYEHICFCDPGDINTALSLANLYLRAGRPQDAIRRFEHAIVMDPDNWDAKDDMVSACAQAGRIDDAIGLLREMISQRPECADQYLRLGDLYNKVGRTQDAFASYKQALTLHPDYLEATIKIGTAHLRAGAHVEAAQAFARAIEINDRIVTAYVGLGVAQLAADHVDDAKNSLEMAAGVEPNSTTLFREMARIQLKVSAARQAKRYVSPRALITHPQGPPPEKMDAILQRQIGNLREALRRHPNHADLHYRLGVLLRSAGELNAAIASFNHATQINPRYVKALTRLAIALREAGDLDGAVAAATQAVEIDEEAVELHYQLGLMYADRSQFALALDRFDHAVRKAPANMDYVANLALALQNMGLMDRAAEAWRTLCDLDADTHDTPAIKPRKSRSAKSRLPRGERDEV